MIAEKITHWRHKSRIWIDAKFSWVPLFGGLTRCSLSDHYKAAKELIVTLFFSTTTFWLAAFLISLTKQGHTVSYWKHLSSTVQNGELTIFAVSLLGPILYLALDDPPDGKVFPGKLSHMFLVIALCLLCGAIYAGMKIGADFDQAALFSTSLYIAITAIALRYLATAYRKSTLRPDADWKEDEDDFSNEYAKR